MGQLGFRMWQETRRSGKNLAGHGHKENVKVPPAGTQFLFLINILTKWHYSRTCVSLGSNAGIPTTKKLSPFLVFSFSYAGMLRIQTWVTGRKQGHWRPCLWPVPPANLGSPILLISHPSRRSRDGVSAVCSDHVSPLCLPVLCLYLDPSILLVSWSFGCRAGHPAFPEGLPRASTRVAGTRCWQPVSWQAQKPSLSEGTEPPPLDFLRQVQPCLSSHSVNTKFEPKCDFKVIHLEKCLS